MVESKLVELVVAGSNPVGHPMFIATTYNVSACVTPTPAILFKGVYCVSVSKCRLKIIACHYPPAFRLSKNRISLAKLSEESEA